MSLESLTGAPIVCIVLELIEENEDAGAGTAALDTVNGMSGWHAPTKQPRQPFLSQSAMRGSHVLACNGVRLTSQLKWRKASQPARFIPYIDCAMLSQFLSYTLLD